MQASPHSVHTVTLLNKLGLKIDSFEIREGLNLWVFIRKRGLAIGSACSGVGVCGACHLKITTHAGKKEAPLQSEFEKQTLLRNGIPREERLACLYRVYQDVTVQSDYW